MEKFSREWQDLIRRGRCPNGHDGRFAYDRGVGAEVEVRLLDRLNSSRTARILAQVYPAYMTTLLSQWGRTAFKLPRVTDFREDSSFSCSQCKQAWPLFEHPEEIVIRNFVTTGRTTTPLGDDDSIRDNRTGNDTMIATIRVSRRWLQRVELSWTEAQSSSVTGSLTLSPKYIGGSIERQITKSVQSSLSLSLENEQTLEQTLQVPIPAGIRLTIRLHWKQVWQEGRVSIQIGNGDIIQVPYRAAVDVTFDQENIRG